MRKSSLVTVATLVLLSGGAVQADPPPPIKPDPVSIDRPSPSIALCGRNSADIYGEVPIGGIVGQGCDVPAAGPILHVPAPTYGLIPRDNNDGHTNGEVNPGSQFVIYFSGDRASIGAGGTAYAGQSALRQAAGDRFVTNGPTSVSPAAAMAACAPGGILGPVWAGPVNLLSVNQTRYNLIPSIPPNVANNGGRLDEVDALELTPWDLNGDNVHDTPVYFTVDRTSPSWAGASDILYSPPGAPFFALFAVAGQLGLLAKDDNVDALAVWDVNGDGVADPGLDYAIFSLDRPSPTLAATGFSAGDILVTDFTGAFCLFLPAPAIGLLPTDNVDGVDVELWTGPGSVEVWESGPGATGTTPR